LVSWWNGLGRLLLPRPFLVLAYSQLIDAESAAGNGEDAEDSAGSYRRGRTAFAEVRRETARTRHGVR
jgi:hypothetical protein